MTNTERFKLCTRAGEILDLLRRTANPAECEELRAELAQIDQVLLEELEAMEDEQWRT
jgi:hypothetical protein